MPPCALGLLCIPLHPLVTHSLPKSPKSCIHCPSTCSHVLDLGLIEARAIPQSECFDAALKFAKTEASFLIILAPQCQVNRVA